MSISVKLTKMTTNATLKIFHVTLTKDTVQKAMSFIADVLPVDDFLPVTGADGNNINSLYSADKTVYYNMYQTDKPYIRSRLLKTKSTAIVGKSSDYLNRTCHIPKLCLQDSTLMKDFIYALEPMTTDGFYSLEQDLLTFISGDNGMSIPFLNQISTVVKYNKDEIVKRVNSISTLNTYDIVSLSSTDISCNYIHEFDDSIYNDLNSSSINAHSFKCKNYIDAEYNMSYNNDSILKNCRKYTSLETCGNNLLYATYIDVIKYNTDGESSDDAKNKYDFKLPCVEVIHKINRMYNDQSNAHTANLYSIDVTVDVLNKIKNSDGKLKDTQINKIKLNIRRELRNCIRSFAESLQPANSLLFLIYVNNNLN